MGNIYVLSIINIIDIRVYLFTSFIYFLIMNFNNCYLIIFNLFIILCCMYYLMSFLLVFTAPNKNFC